VPVGDVAKAAAYYERFFELRPRSMDQESALLIGHGVQLRLRRGDGPASDEPAAVLRVVAPEVLRRRYDDLGAHLHDLPGGFGVRDCYGNVLHLVGRAPLRGAVADLADRGLRWIGRTVDAVRDRREARRWRAAAPRRPGVVFLHAGRGLLHWLATTERHLAAAGADVVVIGSDLTADERDWITGELRRPLHQVSRPMDDAGALELLFAGARHDFTWVELGCLVLDAAVLRDLAAPPEDAALTCAWSYDSGFGFRVAAPYLLHVRAAALGRVRRTRPGVYSWRRFNRQVEGRRCYSRVPGRRMRAAMGTPPDPDGRPRVPAGLPFFETTVAYQLAARSRGFGTVPVRTLEALGNARGADVQDEYSDELVYIGALSYADPLEEFSGYFHDDAVRLLHLLAEHVALAPFAGTMPEPYRERLDAIEDALRERGIAPAAVPALVAEHLVAARGLSRAAAERATGQRTVLVRDDVRGDG
jgi:hypothetical protein